MFHTKSYDFVTFGKSKLHFKVCGSSKDVIFLFHGFGQDHTIFESWENSLSLNYTIYSFDLFYHGSSWREDTLLLPDEWGQLLNALIERYSIDQFSVLGYSLGGRFALLTISLFQDHIQRLYLLAPDALYHSDWFKMAMRFKPVFSYLMHHKDAYDRFVRLSLHTGLADKTLAKFSKNELKTEGDRKRVFRTWTFFRKLALPHEVIREIISRNQIKTKVILGEKDNIIMPDKIIPVFNGLSTAEVILLAKRHHEIMEALNLDLLLPD